MTTGNTAERSALRLFHEMARRVPAYSDFLHRQGVNPAEVRTIADFHQLPIIDKKNYLNQYALPELSWDGSLSGLGMISVSSGSTGQPFFWPRGVEHDREGAWFHKHIFDDIFGIHDASTLLVVCFSMGTWIAGSYTTASALQLIAEGMPLNVVTPGIEKAEAIKAIKHLAPHYKQVILAGYPPLTKDIIDEGRREGINWRKFRVRFLWAGEAFSEEWRDYVLSRVGQRDPYHDSASIFGSADAGLLGHETPMSVLVRRLYNRRPVKAAGLFGTPILPALAQYYPERRYFEQVGGELVFTARSGIPLVRYNIHDTGGVLTYEQATAPIAPVLMTAAVKYHVDESRWRLPFLYLGGRKDFTITIYGVNIYPENIKAAIMDPQLRGRLTGKFTMATKHHSDMDQFFEVNVELAQTAIASDELRLAIERVVVARLCRLNAEYRRLYGSVGAKVAPVINLIEWGHPEYFTIAAKHRWVKH